MQVFLKIEMNNRYFTQNRLQGMILGQKIGDQNTIFNCSLYLGLVLKVYQVLFTNTKTTHLSLVCYAFGEFLAFRFLLPCLLFSKISKYICFEKSRIQKEAH